MFSFASLFFPSGNQKHEIRKGIPVAINNSVVLTEVFVSVVGVEFFTFMLTLSHSPHHVHLSTVQVLSEPRIRFKVTATQDRK